MALLRRGRHGPDDTLDAPPAEPAPPARPARVVAVPPVLIPDSADRRPEAMRAVQEASEAAERADAERRAAERQALAQRGQDEQKLRGERLRGAEAVAQAANQVLARARLAMQAATNSGDPVALADAAMEVATAERAAQLMEGALRQVRGAR